MPERDIHDIRELTRTVPITIPVPHPPRRRGKADPEQAPTPDTSGESTSAR